MLEGARAPVRAQPEGELLQPAPEQLRASRASGHARRARDECRCLRSHCPAGRRGRVRALPPPTHVTGLSTCRLELNASYGIPAGNCQAGVE